MGETRQKEEQVDPSVELEEVDQKAAIAAALKQNDGIDEEQVAMFQRFMAADEEWHRHMEGKLLRKIDFRLLPMLILMYLLNFLDRKYVGQHSIYRGF